MKIKDLLAKPENWCQGELAVNKFNESVAIDSPEAARWCLVGGFARCYSVRESPSIWTKLYDRCKILGFQGPVHLNNTCTHEEVLKLVTELDI